MSSTSWKLLGRKQGGNMKNNRNVKSNQFYNNNGNWNTVYTDDDIKRLAYYNIDLPHVVGIGTQTPFSKLSFGDSSNSGHHPKSLGNVESTTGLTAGKLSSIALHEVTRNEENQPERRGQEFNGIGYVTNLMNVRNIDKNNTEANGVGIFSNKFAATEDTSQKTDKAIMYVTDSKHIQIGGVPTGYNLIDRRGQSNATNPSFIKNTQETGPNIILDISGSMHVNGFINFLKHGVSSTIQQNEDNPANQMTLSTDGTIKFADSGDKTRTDNRAAPEGSIFVGWDKDGSTSLKPMPRLYIMVNGIQKRIATEDDKNFYEDDGGDVTQFPITGNEGGFGEYRFYIFRNVEDNPGALIVNTYSGITGGDFKHISGGNPDLTPPKTHNNITDASSPAPSQSLQLIGGLSVFDGTSGGTSGEKLETSQYKVFKQVLVSEIYQSSDLLIDNNNNNISTGKELGSIYTDRHLMIGGFQKAGPTTIRKTFDAHGSAIDISGGTTGKPIMRAITGDKKGSIKDSDPRDSIIIGNTDPNNFSNGNTECILVGENAKYENNENTLVMGTNNTVKNTKNSIIVGKNITASFASDTDGVVALGEGDATVDFDAKDRIVFFTKDPLNPAKKALTIDNSGNVTIKGDLEVEGEHVHLEVTELKIKDPTLELNVDGNGNGVNLGSTAADQGGIVIKDDGSEHKFLWYGSNGNPGEWRSNATALATGTTGSEGQFKSNGNTNVTLITGNTSSGFITITNGANQNITLGPDGTGKIEVGGSSPTITTDDTKNLKLDTNNGIDSGSITITNGADQNITLAPNGTGEVVISGTNPTITTDSNKNIKIEPGTGDVIIYEAFDGATPKGAEFVKNAGKVDLKISGKLHVLGLIDPTGLILDKHTVTDLEIDGTEKLAIYNDGTGNLKFKYKNNNSQFVTRTFSTVEGGGGGQTISGTITNAVNATNARFAQDISFNSTPAVTNQVLYQKTNTNTEPIPNGTATSMYLKTGTSSAAPAFATIQYSEIGGTVPTWNQDTTGNASTASKLASSVTIGGVSFDGSTNINLPGVNTGGDQDTTGSAATLTTARNIAGVSFDGSSDIDIAFNNLSDFDGFVTPGNFTGSVAPGTSVTLADGTSATLGAFNFTIDLSSLGKLAKIT